MRVDLPGLRSCPERSCSCPPAVSGLQGSAPLPTQAGWQSGGSRAERSCCRGRAHIACRWGGTQRSGCCSRRDRSGAATTGRRHSARERAEASGAADVKEQELAAPRVVEYLRRRTRPLLTSKQSQQSKFRNKRLHTKQICVRRSIYSTIGTCGFVVGGLLTTSFFSYGPKGERATAV